MSKKILIPIPDEEWICPECGSHDIFVDPTEEHDADDESGDIFWDTDAVICPSCNRDWNLASFIRRWLKKKNMVKCQCCNGTGLVRSE